MQPRNDPPTITRPGDVSVPAGGSSGPVNFTVNDVDAGDTLTVTAVSTNTVLVPNANIVLGGSGDNRTVAITPVGTGGEALIILTVTDALGESAEASFLVKIGFKYILPIIFR